MISMLKDAERKGHATTANVTSIAASMASVVACACQTLKLYEGAYLMCHLPWTMAIGNTNDLEKEIATLNQLKNGMVKIYKTKFDLSDDEIDAMLSAETWIDADNYKDWKLNCEIVENGEPLKIAASISEKHFKNIPRGLMTMNRTEQADDIQKEEEVVVEEKADETTAETIVEEPEEKEEEQSETKDETVPEEEGEPSEGEPTIDDLKSRIAELEAQLADANARIAEYEKKCGEADGEEDNEDEEVLNKEQVQARISGIQSSMQKQINDFKSQLQVKDEELIKAKADITSLNQKLEQSERELSETASALAERESALAKLNANVNAHAEELPTMKEGLAKCATPAERVAFLKSGKYVR